MANRAAALQKALESRPQAEAEVASAAAVAAVGPQASRVGKVNISAYLSPSYKKNLRLIQVQEDINIQSLIAEALNLLFEKHNVPTIQGE